MSLPITAVIMPAVLAGQPNGQLPDDLLAGINSGRLLASAARAWHAMVADARRVGIMLEASEGYRSLEDQTRIFMERYTLEPLDGRPTKQWYGSTYWLRHGEHTAAVPGTSNHGWGLAVDVRAVDYAGRLMWLVYNAHRFGFSAELPSEAWHWRYYAGDTLDFPDIPDEDDMTDEQIEKLARRTAELMAPAVAHAIMTYPIGTRDFDREGAPEIVAPLASIEGWRNTELSMLRRGIGRHA